MMDSVLELLRNGGDSLAAAQLVERDVTELSHIGVAKRYSALVNDLYWKGKEVSFAIWLGRFGAHYCLTHAAKRGDAAALELRSIAKQLAYNMGSFAWPGWAEPGITLSEADLAAGRDAAKLNLRLAVELNRPAKGMSNAHWLIGAYALADGKTPEAVAAFDRAAALGDDAAAAAMNRAYASLAQLAADRHNTLLQQAFADALAALPAAGPDGSAYAEQLQSARHVFVP
jgi:hypothetical protein